MTNDVLFHEPKRRIMQDVVTAICHNVAIDAIGFRRERHADRYLKSPQEMHRLFARYPEALARTIEIARRCAFSLSELEYQYPEERSFSDLTPQEAPEKFTWESAEERYPEGVPDRVRKILLHELALIRAGLRAVLPDRQRDRAFCKIEGNPLSGARFGRKFRRLLCARHYIHRPGSQ